MRSLTWRMVGWHVLALLSYLAGMLLFLIVILDVLGGPGDQPIGDLTLTHLLYLLASLVLITGGRLAQWKFGGNWNVATWTDRQRGGAVRQPPEGNQLEQLGYNVPEERNTTIAYEDGQVYSVCQECGAKNEPEYDYCENCAGELPKGSG